MLRTEEPMRVATEADLIDLTRSLGVFDQVARGDAHCSFCGRPVSFGSILAIYPGRDGNVCFVSRHPECAKRFAVTAQRLGLT